MIVALILCGGGGRRIGGRNKPLIELAGSTLIERVVERLAAQVDDIVISANQDIATYERLGYAVVSDEPGTLAAGLRGPLAGVLAGIRHLQAQGRDHDCRLQLSPGDTPFLPENLVRRLNGPGAAVPFDGERAHHLHSQMSIASALDALEAAPGQAAVHRWLARQNARQVDFSDAANAFLNINTDEQLIAARRTLAAGA